MKYLVRCPDLGGSRDAAETIDARSHDVAVKMFAAAYDMQAADYLFAKDDYDVHVVPAGENSGPVHVFGISSETVVHYRAKLK